VPSSGNDLRMDGPPNEHVLGINGTTAKEYV
jgi:hypothetical protein